MSDQNEQNGGAPDPGPAVAENVPERAALEEELRKKTEEAAANYDRYVRALADAENFKKRMQRDKVEAIRYANENLLRDLLQVIDSLDLALEHAQQGGDGKSLAEGVGLTRKLFRDVLERHGAKELGDPAGAPFDPTTQEASALEEHDTVPPNSVIRGQAKGYTYNERLLRPARVVVAAGPAKKEG